MKKIFLFVLTRSAGTLSFAQNGNTTAPQIFSYVERMPQSTVDLEKYLKEHLKYPIEAIGEGIEGRVVVKFVVNEDGTTSNFNIVRSVDPMLDSEAIKVLRAVPAWKPGMQNGKAVKVYLTLPVAFKLQDTKGKLPVFSYVEQMPVSTVDMGHYLSENLVYPEDARRNKVEGRVIVKFVVNREGDVDSVRVLKPVYPSLDSAAVKVISSMSRWMPGKQNGKPVSVYFTQPIQFRLPDHKPE